MMRIALVVLSLASFAAAQEPTCDVTPLSVTLPHWGGTADFKVTGDRAWVPMPIDARIQVVGMTNDGNGEGYFTIGLAPNTGAEWTGHLRVGGRLVSVTQRKAPGKK